MVAFALQTIPRPGKVNLLSYNQIPQNKADPKLINSLTDKGSGRNEKLPGFLQ